MIILEHKAQSKIQIFSCDIFLEVALLGQRDCLTSEAVDSSYQMASQEDYAKPVCCYQHCKRICVSPNGQGFLVSLTVFYINECIVSVYLCIIHYQINVLNKVHDFTYRFESYTTFSEGSMYMVFLYMESYYCAGLLLCDSALLIFFLNSISLFP